MTQYNQTPYPDPNQPPMPGYAPADPYAQQPGPALKMCRAAAILQAAFGAVICLLAFCVAAAGMIVTSGAMPLDQQPELAELTAQFGDAAGLMFIVTGICVGIPGLLQMVMGIWVWKGAKWAIITSIVVNALFGALMLVNVAAMLASGMQNPAGACTNVFLFAAVAGLITLLVMAYRESGAAAAVRDAYAAQWQQYYHQYQAALYQQQGPPMPQPPAPPPPASYRPADPSDGTPPPPPAT